VNAREEITETAPPFGWIKRMRKAVNR